MEQKTVCVSSDELKCVLSEELSFDTPIIYANIDSENESILEASRRFKYLHSQVKRMKGMDIKCWKYNCTFNLFNLQHGGEGINLYINSNVQTQIGTPRSPSTLKEMSLLKVTQQLPMYDIDALCVLYFKLDHLTQNIIRGGRNGFRRNYKLERILLIMLSQKLGFRFRREEKDVFNEHFFTDTSMFCEECSIIEFDSNFNKSLEPHCMVCAFIAEIRFSTKILEKNGHFSQCSQKDWF